MGKIQYVDYKNAISRGMVICLNDTHFMIPGCKFCFSFLDNQGLKQSVANYRQGRLDGEIFIPERRNTTSWGEWQPDTVRINSHGVCLMDLNIK